MIPVNKGKICTKRNTKIFEKLKVKVLDKYLYCPYNIKVRVVTHI